MASARRLPTSYNESAYGNATRDYTSLAAWESDTDIDLVSAGDGEILTCYDDSAPYDDTIEISGGTADADYFRVIRALAGQEGTQTTGVRFNSSKFDTFYSIEAYEDYCGVYDIGFKVVVSNGYAGGIYTLTGSHQRVIGCFFYDIYSGRSSTSIAFGVNCQSSGAIVANCFATNISGANISATTAIGGFCSTAYTAEFNQYFYNNTSVGNYAGVCIRAAAGRTINLYTKNNILQGNTSDDIRIIDTGTKNLYQTTNAVDDGVVFEADGYHLDSTDTAALGEGTDLSADGVFAFDDDIDGDTISGAWCIGCDFYAADIKWAADITDTSAATDLTVAMDRYFVADIADATGTTDIIHYMRGNLVAAIADDTATNATSGAARLISPFDFLPIAVADYDFLFDINAQNRLPVTGGKNQIIIKKDSGAVSVLSVSDQSFFTFTLQWARMLIADYAVLFDLYHDATKANAMARTFYWLHPVSNQIYVARFMSELPAAWDARWTTRVNDVSIDIRLEGRKA